MSAGKAGKVHTLGLSNFEVKGAEDIYRWCIDSTEIFCCHFASWHDYCLRYCYQSPYAKFINIIM